MSSEFQAAPQALRPQQWHQSNFLKRLDDLFANTDQVREAAKLAIAHIRSGFADAPVGDADGKPPLASFFAYLIHNMASHYHWTERHIMHELPLARLWQYLRLIEKANDPEVIGSNPSEAERMRIFEEVQAEIHTIENAHRDVYSHPQP